MLKNFVYLIFFTGKNYPTSNYDKWAYLGSEN